MKITVISEPQIYEQKDMEGKSTEEMFDSMVADFKTTHLPKMKTLNPKEFIGLINLTIGE